ncbi:hypothetical protein SteCoe_32619 [Stentor coeruleus]|uniref:Ankyrin repeat protein n=1 Tax=Stentor coeruleus TaxID=5963 RepID=A0A1R2AYJ7_9CILI|nr:hypothetical protein SteCoe_32619 [Stentor coeruleus]
MGNCHKEKMTEYGIQDRIFDAIQSGAFHRVSSIVNFAKMSIGIKGFDNLKTKYSKVTTNPMGLCLIFGYHDMFKFMLESGCSPFEMEKCFSITQFSSMEHICYKGYIEILKLYLPIFLTELNNINLNSPKSYSILLSTSYSMKSRSLPIHQACKRGREDIVNYLYKYFKGSESIPKEYDIESLEENTGENCALIACRYGHLSLIQYLHSECQANFHIINNYNENAIITTIAGMNKNPHTKYIQVIKYLVEDVKINVMFMYEEALFLTKSKPVYDYLADVLQKNGLVIERKAVDDTNFVFKKTFYDYDNPLPEKVITDSFIEGSKNTNVRSRPSSIHWSVSSFDLKDIPIF